MFLAKPFLEISIPIPIQSTYSLRSNIRLRRHYCAAFDIASKYSCHCTWTQAVHNLGLCFRAIYLLCSGSVSLCSREDLALHPNLRSSLSHSAIVGALPSTENDHIYQFTRDCLCSHQSFSLFHSDNLCQPGPF